jgi:hypothetical protein
MFTRSTVLVALAAGVLALGPGVASAQHGGHGGGHGIGIAGHGGHGLGAHGGFGHPYGAWGGPQSYLSRHDFVRRPVHPIPWHPTRRIEVEVLPIYPDYPVMITPDMFPLPYGIFPGWGNNGWVDPTLGWSNW